MPYAPMRRRHAAAFASPGRHVRSRSGGRAGRATSSPGSPRCVWQRSGPGSAILLDVHAYGKTLAGSLRSIAFSHFCSYLFFSCLLFSSLLFASLLYLSVSASSPIAGQERFSLPCNAFVWRPVSKNCIDRQARHSQSPQKMPVSRKARCGAVAVWF